MVQISTPGVTGEWAPREALFVKLLWPLVDIPMLCWKCTSTHTKIFEHGRDDCHLFVQCTKTKKDEIQLLAVCCIVNGVGWCYALIQKYAVICRIWSSNVYSQCMYFKTIIIMHCMWVTYIQYLCNVCICSRWSHIPQANIDWSSQHAWQLAIVVLLAMTGVMHCCGASQGSGVGVVGPPFTSRCTAERQHTI